MSSVCLLWNSLSSLKCSQHFGAPKLQTDQSYSNSQSLTLCFSVSYLRKEALSLAKGSNSLKSTLSDYEFTLECQSKELATLHMEQKKLKEALAEAQRENDELLQRWLEKKKEEAYRVNEYNNTQEKYVVKSTINHTFYILHLALQVISLFCSLGWLVWLITSRSMFTKKWTRNVFLW